MSNTDISVVILTYNAEKHITSLLNKLSEQTVNFDIFVIDSSSIDNTALILNDRSVPFVTISPIEFDHGGTRNLALGYIKTKYVVYLTQDALPADKYAIENLILPIRQNNRVVMTYGQQLPYPEATLLSSFARMANYPEKSIEKNRDMIPKMGIKTCHISNSFAAYDVSFLKQIGMFPVQCIMCEDVYVGAKAILSGKSIYYSAEAKVFHSHNYNLKEEFKRYFDIGVFYHSEKWILNDFFGAESEGVKYVINELRYLVKHRAFLLIPESVARVFCKYFGYRLGKYEKSIPVNLKRRLSMHSNYWLK